MGPPCPAANVNAGWAPMQPTWVGKRGWRLAVLRGVLPRTSYACYDSNYFLLSRRRSGRLPLQGTGRPASAVSRGAPLPTANRKPGMAVVSHCSPAAPRRALFNVAAPFRPAALAMGRPCPAVNSGWAQCNPHGCQNAAGASPGCRACYRALRPRPVIPIIFAVAASFRPAALARGWSPSAVSRGASCPTANQKPGRAVVSHCGPTAPRRALFNVAAPFRPAALAMGRPCRAVNSGWAPMQPTWVAQRGWRLAVLRGGPPLTSPAHHDSHHFLLPRRHSGRLPSPCCGALPWLVENHHM